MKSKNKADTILVYFQGINLCGPDGERPTANLFSVQYHDLDMGEDSRALLASAPDLDDVWRRAGEREAEAIANDGMTDADWSAAQVVDDADVSRRILAVYL